MPLGAFRLNAISAASQAVVYTNRYGNAFTPTTGTVISNKK